MGIDFGAITSQANNIINTGINQAQSWISSTTSNVVSHANSIISSYTNIPSSRTTSSSSYSQSSTPSAQLKVVQYTNDNSQPIRIKLKNIEKEQQVADPYTEPESINRSQTFINRASEYVTSGKIVPPLLISGIVYLIIK